MHAAEPLYSTEGVRAIDRAAINHCGIAGYMLMCRAGAAAFDALRSHWPQACRLLVVCGSGNNGGDGFVVARLARSAGMQVDVLALTEQPHGEEAIEAWWAWREAGGVLIQHAPGTPLPAADVIVDAIFGIGLSRAPEGAAASLIEAINAHPAPCFALDVASGVDADTGAVPGVAVRAAHTISFIAAKRGLYTGLARDFCGQVALCSLDVPAEAFSAAKPVAMRLSSDMLGTHLPPRRANAHKGEFGHVIAVGGDLGFGGALSLCVQAAARTGAGLVTAITRSAHRSGLLAAVPECMLVGCDNGDLPVDLLHRASVLALGPGLGTAEWGRDLFPRMLALNKLMVLDADALNLLAEAPRAVPGKVLTPHPGEAARLLGLASASSIQRDRFDALARLVERYQAVVVLKGAGTLVGAPSEPPMVINAGNPGMASGGMGDVLTGVIAGLLAQGFAPFPAAAIGALLHAAAGDVAARMGGMRGLLASDLLPELRRLANSR